MTGQHDTREHWDNVYKTKAADQVSWFEDSPDRSLAWIAEAGIRPDDAVIDIGGGLSSLARALMSRGHTDVSVLDISQTAIERQRERLGDRLKGIAADITLWRPGRSYALWHDRAVLHFLLTDDQRAAYRAALMKAIDPGGQAVIATFAPDGPERCSGLPVRRYGQADLAEFLGQAFQVEASELFEHVTPSGAIQRFHVGRARRIGV